VRYIDVCSGISAPTAAWKPLGWQALCYAEIEAAPRAVLAHHYPDVPLVGDFTQIKGNEYGTRLTFLSAEPPASRSASPALEADWLTHAATSCSHLALWLKRYHPRWLVWENVPGVLSSGGGRDFGTFLGMLAELGYGFAYRVLDAQQLRSSTAPPPRVRCRISWRLATCRRSSF
jgi:DNA (cytosine-5)-methyltransferase 1